MGSTNKILPLGAANKLNVDTMGGATHKKLMGGSELRRSHKNNRSITEIRGLILLHSHDAEIHRTNKNKHLICIFWLSLPQKLCLCVQSIFDFLRHPKSVSESFF